MGRYWDSWIDKIIEERASSNPTDRRRGFLRQLATELVVYATAGIIIVLIGLCFDYLTPLVVFTNPFYEGPVLVGAITAVLFQSVWDNWLRELEDPAVDDEGERGERELAPDQTTLDGDTGASRRS